MILVTGAAGKTGQAVIKALVARKSQPVRALVRRDEQTQIVKSLGAKEAIVGDMRDATTLKRATQGVHAVYHICPNVSPEEIQIGKQRLLLPVRQGRSGSSSIQSCIRRRRR